MKKQMLNEARYWDAAKTRLMEGLSGTKQRNMGMILENTRKYLMEAPSIGATGAGNIASLNKVMLPLLRRVMPSVIANEIMGVQPMSSPVAQIHTLRVRYGNNTGDFPAGTEALGPFDIAKAYSGNNVPNANVNPRPGPTGTASLESVRGNQMNVQIIKEVVEAKTRKLSAIWTFEAAQDADSTHGVDIEAEIMQALAQEITVEIDQEMLNNLRALVGPAPVIYDQGAVSGTATFVGDEHAALAILINQQANLIAARTRRGAANWAVVSPNALTILQSATTSAFARSTEGTFEAPTNTKRVGTLNGAMRVYVDQYASDGEAILMGYKGESETDCAAYYCPYIPLMSVGPIIDSSTMEPVVQFMTRYGYLELNNSSSSFGNASDYLSKVGIDTTNLQFF